MITFICCLATLIAGYFIYGSFIERIFGVDPSRTTPAYTHQDGVDYIPMSSWKVFMIQFLECFHYVITGKASRRLSGVILEITSSNSCAASLWS